MVEPSFSIPTPKGERRIGSGYPCFIVAEVSANHGQDLKKAEEIIRRAAAAGADAIKLQTYLPSTMTIDCDAEPFLVQGEVGPGEWKNQTLYELYKKAYTPWEWHPGLQKLTEDLGMVFFSTPFDETAVDFLEKLDVPLYKIASYELTDIPLLKRVAKTGKPVIFSTGFGNLDEVTEAAQTLREHGVKQIAILHCVTHYSKDPDEGHTNLSTMRDLARRFDVVVGFSDNTGGIEVPLQAVHMGAAIIEKHVVVEEGDQVLDGAFSLGPKELKSFVDAVRRSEKISGRPSYGPQSENEKYFQRFRRSVFAIEDIRKGEVLSSRNTRVIRPANGLAPRYFEEVIGRRAAADVPRGTPLTWEHLE